LPLAQAYQHFLLPLHWCGPAKVGEIAALTVAANAKVSRARAKNFFMIFPLID
jgi:hypothetical protein